jgi:hypothetical protein
VAQGIGSEFKPQYCRKGRKEERRKEGREGGRNEGRKEGVR